jgi:hypothetical protein
MLSGEATNTNFSLWLTQLELKPTIYSTQGEYANHYTTDAVDFNMNVVDHHTKEHKICYQSYH